MRALRNLGIFLLVVVVILAALDVGVRLFVESRIEKEIRTADEEAIIDVSGAEASVSSFPFVGRLAASGQVDHFNLRLTDIGTEQGRLSALELDVDDVVFDRSNLFNGRIEVTSIGNATLSAEIDEQTASEVVGVPVTLAPGEVTVTVGGQARPAGFDVAGGAITLSVPELPAIPLPENDYLPCAVDAQVEEGKFVLSCTVDALPPAIDEAIGRARLG